ncbi:hypothetical protein EDD22DRAFT_841906 [Suillus occidentalis]|nr:hypothetical protein EDD22DRAFT_841906 [Suillus occidentalis]
MQQVVYPHPATPPLQEQGTYDLDDPQQIENPASILVSIDVSWPLVITEHYSESATSWMHQMVELTKRNFLAYWCNPMYLIAKIILNIMGEQTVHAFLPCWLLRHELNFSMVFSFVIILVSLFTYLIKGLLGQAISGVQW